MALDRVSDLVANTVGLKGLSLEVIENADKVEILDTGVLKVIARFSKDGYTCEDALYLAPGEWQSFARRGTTVVIEQDGQVVAYETGLSTDGCVKYVTAYFQEAEDWDLPTARRYAEQAVYNQATDTVYGSNRARFRFVTSDD